MSDETHEDVLKSIVSRKGSDKDTRELLLEMIRALPSNSVARDSSMGKSLAVGVELSWKRASQTDRGAVLNELDRVFEDDTTGPIAKRVSFDQLITEGWFKGFLDYTAPGKSSPQFFFAAAVTYIAASLGRRPMIPWGALVDNLYPNLYTLMVGGSGSGKGAAISRAAAIVCPAGQPFILPNEGSASGYADALKERYDATGDQADGLIVAEEFKVLLSRDRYKEQVVTWLTQWYQWSGPWSRALSTRAAPYFENPCVSILAGSNMAWLKKIPSDAILGGFFPRMWVLDTPQEEERWGKAFPVFDDALGLGLTEMLTDCLGDVPEAIVWPKLTLDWWETWYASDHRENFQAHSDEQMRYYLSRKQSLAMKLATIKHVVDHGGGDASIEPCAWAVAILDWCDRSVVSVYGQLAVTPDGEIADDVLRIVGLTGSIDDRKIKRALRNKYRAFSVGQTLEALAYQGELRKVTGDGGSVQWEVVE